MSKVYGISRVSSVGQSDNTSINNQNDTITKYCDLYNLQLIEIVEEVFTGTTEDRDGLNYLMEKVERGECDTIVVYKIDRLMRDFRSGINFIGDLMKHNCKIVSTQEQIDTSSISGEFFMNVLLSMSQMEKQTITQRLQWGKEYRFQKEKKLVCSSPPFSYKRVNGDILVVEEESEIVKYIFRLWKRYSDLPKNRRTSKVVKMLDRRGFTFRGKKFDCRKVKFIIQNQFYVGVMSMGEFGVTKHKYPKFISKRLFNHCNQLNNWRQV